MSTKEETPAYTDLVRNLSPEKWSEVFGASSRKARETYFHRHGIRKPKTGIKLSRTTDKTEIRVANLWLVLKEKDDHEMVEEIVRTYLLSKREMLAATLDYLEIDHDDGLTESDDVDKIKGLKGKELRALCKTLTATYAKEDVELYLGFMGAKRVDEACG